MEISAAMVRELREKTGLPMMECKQALTEAQGDMAKAIEVLKRFGSAKISKMATRETSQGRIACHVAGQRASIVEVLCETAPVANTDDFQALAKAIAEAAAALSVERAAEAGFDCYFVKPVPFDLLTEAIANLWRMRACTEAAWFQNASLALTT